MVSLIEWSFQKPWLRSRIFRLRRWPLRMSPGFIAEAAVVVRSNDGRVLLIKEASGELVLPRLSVEGRQSVHLQVAALLEELLEQPASASLVSAVGVVGDMTFLFRAEAPANIKGQGGRSWLAPDVAATALSPKDARLLALSG